MQIIEIETKYNNVELKKTKGYALSVCNKLMSSPCVIGDLIKTQAIENELYIRGAQDETKYKAYFSNKFSKNKMENYFKVDDLDLSPLGLCRIVFKSIYARLNKADAYCELEFIDEKSTKENKSFILELETLLKIQQPLKEITGMDVVKDKMNNKLNLDKYTPSSLEELKFYNDIGYKKSIELLIEKHLDIINNGNNFDFELAPQINLNLIISGIVGTYLYYNNDNSIVEEYVHIKDLKVVGGVKRNYEDAKGYIIDKQFSVDEFFELVKDSIIENNIMEGNENFDLHGEYIRLKNSANKDGILDVKLCYWSTIDSYNLKTVFNPISNDIFVRNHKGSAVITNKIQKWYFSYYIPALQEVYKYGYIPNMSRKKINGKFQNAYSPVTVIRGIHSDLSKNSVISLIKRLEDTATVLWGKFQNEIARIKPTRTDIDLKALAETAELLKVAMPDIQVTDLMHALNLGLGITTSSNLDNTKSSNQNNFRTVTYPVQLLNSYLNVINIVMEMCFQFTGTPRIDVGIEQSDRISNFVTKAGMQGADRAILELFEIKDELIRFSAEKKINMVVSLYQNLDRNLNPYATLFDDYEVNMLSEIDFLINREFTVKIKKGFTDEEIIEIKQNLSALNQVYMQTGGERGIDFADNLMIEHILQDSPKMARYKIQILLNRRKEEAQRAAMERQKMNQQVQMQSSEQKQQGEAQMLSMKAQIDKMKQDFEMQYAELKSNLKMKEDANKLTIEHKLNSNEYNNN